LPKLPITSIDTPAVLIERSILEENIQSMQELADRSNVNLRVHIKTHKIPELARLQIKAGAVGIAVAKLGEAEIMADAGIKDIQIANIIVGEEKIKRLLELRKQCKLSVAVDSIGNAKELSKAFSKNGRRINVLLKVNTGLNRCGLGSLDEIIRFLKRTTDLSGINLVGLMTHAGHAYAASTRGEIKAIGRSEGSTLVEYARRLRALGNDMRVLSVGSTPTAKYCAKVRGITELRVGNYIFNDMTQVALGTVPMSRCALSVLATVISTPSKDRAVVDAGSKAFGLDKGAHGRETLKGYGKIGGGGGVLMRLSEEHGIIENVSRRFKIGQKLRIIPNHACTVMNLFDFAYLVDAPKIIKRYDISARGKMS
jgi:D-serine deaminase-like pyridoxal phosphate-dependent protein